MGIGRAGGLLRLEPQVCGEGDGDPGWSQTILLTTRYVSFQLDVTHYYKQSSFSSVQLSRSVGVQLFATP